MCIFVDKTVKLSKGQKFWKELYQYDNKLTTPYTGMEIHKSKWNIVRKNPSKEKMAPHISKYNEVHRDKFSVYLRKPTNNVYLAFRVEVKEICEIGYHDYTGIMMALVKQFKIVEEISPPRNTT